MKTEELRNELLALIREQPDYGLSLRDRLAQRGVAVRQFTIYPVLRKMEREGLLVSEPRYENLEERVGKPRIYYKLKV